MAQKRMFAMKIIDTDAFLDMPLSTQCLYFHLNMRADDDGFIGNPKRVQKLIGATDDDLRLLIAKQYVIAFDNGVIVIRHWRLHNTLLKDRYQPSVYIDEASMLEVESNKAYKLKDGIGLPDNEEKAAESDAIKDSINAVLDKWLELLEYGVPQVSKISSASKRYKNLKARIEEYGVDTVLEAIENIKHSSFLQGKGQGDRSWRISFDWFVLPNNFPKVLEGNYTDQSGGISRMKEVSGWKRK